MIRCCVPPTHPPHPQFSLELYYHNSGRKTFVKLQPGIDVMEFRIWLKVFKMQLPLILSPEKLPGWQEVEGRGKLYNHHVIENINNFDVENVNASDHKAWISSRVCVNLTKANRSFGEECFILHLYFVRLETNESFASPTITILSHSYLKCLSCGAFPTRWFIWGKLKDIDCLAKFHGCFSCVWKTENASFQLWGMGSQLDNLSLLSFSWKCVLFCFVFCT